MIANFGMADAELDSAETSESGVVCARFQSPKKFLFCKDTKSAAKKPGVTPRGRMPLVMEGSVG